MNGYNDDQNQYNQNNNNGYQSDERYRLEQERQIQIEDERLRRILAEIDQKSSFECSLNVAAQWNFETNVNEITQVEAVSTFSQNSQYKWFTVAKFISINFTYYHIIIYVNYVRYKESNIQYAFSITKYFVCKMWSTFNQALTLISNRSTIPVLISAKL